MSNAARLQGAEGLGHPPGVRGWGTGRQLRVYTCRRSVPAAAPEPEVDEAPVPDLVGSILSGQSLLMMNGADVVIHRDGSLSAKRAGESAATRGLSTGTPSLPWSSGNGPLGSPYLG